MDTNMRTEQYRFRCFETQHLKRFQTNVFSHSQSDRSLWNGRRVKMFSLSVSSPNQSNRCHGNCLLLIVELTYMYQNDLFSGMDVFFMYKYESKMFVLIIYFKSGLSTSFHFYYCYFCYYIFYLFFYPSSSPDFLEWPGYWTHKGRSTSTA